MIKCALHANITTTCNNYNKVCLRIPKIYNLKFING